MTFKYFKKQEKNNENAARATINVNNMHQPL